MTLVVGGGFSGLVAAYQLAKKGEKVRLVEKSNSWGGLIATVHYDWGFAERAANGFLNSPDVEELFDELSLKPAKKSQFAKKKYIYRRGVKKWPLGIFSSLSLVFKLPKVMKAFPKKSQTIYDWGIKNLGEEPTNFLLVPALQGIYAGDAKRLSASLILERVFKKEKRPALKYGRGTIAPEGGMQRLIEALVLQLGQMGAELILNANIEQEMKYEGPKVLCTPANVSAELLGENFQVEYAPLAEVTLSHQHKKHRGFGCLFPKEEGFHSLGAIFCDGLFQPERNIERWVLGGATKPELAEMSKEEVLALAIQDAEKLYGAKVELKGFHVDLWPRAVPQYNTDLEELLPNLQNKNGNIRLFGNYMGGLGLGQVLKKAKEL